MSDTQDERYHEAVARAQRWDDRAAEQQQHRDRLHALYRAHIEAGSEDSPEARAIWAGHCVLDARAYEYLRNAAECRQLAQLFSQTPLAEGAA